jgi:small-conductance mechanosensitive channel
LKQSTDLQPRARFSATHPSLEEKGKGSRRSRPSGIAATNGESEQRIVEQTRNLDRLEQAAQDSQNASIPARRWEQPAKVKPSWFVPYLAALTMVGVGLLVLEFVPNLLAPSTALKVSRYLFGAGAILILLTLTRASEIYAIGRLHSAVSRFNLRRIVRLSAALISFFIVVSVLFVNWYAAVVSLGLISLILGFALQSPISSFVGWIYILIRAPYRVGDRIEIGDVRGDVIDVSYLDTTVWEIGGRHLSTDHPSGRLIKFPNTNVFTTPVFNYSWRLFPYVWNEIKFEIAYESDLEFVANTMESVAQAELGKSMEKNVKRYRDLLSGTPVNDVEVKERPVVVFRPNPNTWVEAILRYLVHPKEAGTVKTVLTRKLLSALNREPEKVLFPKSNLR